MIPLDIAVKFDEKALLEEIARVVDTGLRRALPAIQKVFFFLIEASVISTPEYQSLQGGRLQGELGIVNPAQACANIIQAIQQALEVSYRKVTVSGRNFDGGFTVSFLRTDLSEVQSLPIAEFISASKDGVSYRIEWLKWLLTAGDSVVIADYSFLPGNRTHSRTGLGIMRRKGSWHVPAEFAGSVTANWLNRAFADIGDRATELIEQELEKVF